MPAKRHSSGCSWAGFTLVELLVVIAVLGVLAAMLLSVLAQARESGRRVACTTNLRQIGIALQVYVDDYDGGYPVPPLDGDPDDDDDDDDDEYGYGGGTDWEDVLQSYMRNELIFRCPSDPSHPEFFDMSYTLNAAFARGLRESAVGYPSQTIIVAERLNTLSNEGQPDLFLWWQWQGNLWPPRAEPDPTPVAARDLALERHLGRLNLLFVDGHVRSARFSSTWGEGTDNQYWPQRP